MPPPPLSVCLVIRVPACDPYLRVATVGQKKEMSKVRTSPCLSAWSFSSLFIFVGFFFIFGRQDSEQLQYIKCNFSPPFLDVARKPNCNSNNVNALLADDSN